jgi:hypothetical protein
MMSAVKRGYDGPANVRRHPEEREGMLPDFLREGAFSII